MTYFSSVNGCCSSDVHTNNIDRYRDIRGNPVTALIN